MSVRHIIKARANAHLLISVYFSSGAKLIKNLIDSDINSQDVYHLFPFVNSWVFFSTIRYLVVALMYKEHSLQSSLFFFVFFFVFCFFPKRDPKVYGGRAGKGSTSILESFFDSPQISVSWKSKSIAQQNSPALQATRNIIKLFIEREPMLTTLLASLLLKYQK